MKLKCIGATETVTGSKHLVQTEKGFNLLLDCGLYQGLGKETDKQNRAIDMEVNPAEINALILSHAHIDHSGNIPLLVKKGYKGIIYCTPPTLKVVEVLLYDSARIHEYDVEYINKKRKNNGDELIEAIYTEADVEHCLKQFQTVPYHTACTLNDEITFTFTDAGHILGSAVVNIVIKENEKDICLTFTGDVGKYNDMLLKDPEVFQQSDYIICESTYGNRKHEAVPELEALFLQIVKSTCIEKKGKLIIPAFSLGRTQEIVFMLDKLKGKGLIPNILVYVDSPLSTNVTEIMRAHVHCFNEKLQDYIKTDSNPFGFNSLKYITEKKDSMALNKMKEPCIIISASGMMDAGRIKHHLANNISNAKNTILVVGYCSPHSLGGHLRNGDKHVRIYGDNYTVNAEVKILDAFSAHADYLELIRFLSCQDKKKVKKIFLVHGDVEQKVPFKDKLMQEGYTDVTIPNKGESFILR
jgi:metallo-beta-lactamase family protein